MTVENLLRFRRYGLKSSSVVTLSAINESGSCVVVRVTNVSVSGVGGVIKETPHKELIVGTIFTEGKIVFDEQEINLGRMVLRRYKSVENEDYVGLSAVDIQIPLEGKLSKHLSNLALDEKGPHTLEIGEEDLFPSDFYNIMNESSNLFSKCSAFSSYISERTKNNPTFQWHSVRFPSKGTNTMIRMPTERRPRKFVTFNGYDYLGFAINDEVSQAAKDAIDNYGFNTTGSFLMCGKTDLHEELEHALADMLGKEDVFLFNSGYDANLGTIQALVSENDLLVADIFSHASIQDACRHSLAAYRVFLHCSEKHMRKVLRENRPNFAGCLAITEGLFSMDGDVPDIEKFCRAAREFEARTFVDEAHSLGTIGPNGLGSCERAGVLSKIDIVMGTLSKSFGASGGFIAASKEVITWLRYLSSAGLFTGAFPTAGAAAALKSIELFKQSDERLMKLRSNITRFREGLSELGYTCSSDPESPIIPVVIPDLAILGKLSAYFRENGLFVNPITAPAVPKNKPRFRFALSALHTDDEIAFALETLKKGVVKFGYQFNNQPEPAEQIR